MELRVNRKRISERIQTIAECGKSEKGCLRVAYSDFDVQIREYIIQLMKGLKMDVSVDSAGNIWGKRGMDCVKSAAKEENTVRKAIFFGSHTDTVPLGGNYDGVYGVIAALECVEVLTENEVHTWHPLEVVLWSNEEGGIVGSSVVSDSFPEKKLKLMTSAGITIEEGIKKIGGNPDNLKSAVLGKEEKKAYLEIHIEQGAVLEEEKLQIGVVEGIVAIKWWKVEVTGFANHAGTTPMDRRQDALLSASIIITAIHRIIKEAEGTQVCNVGEISIKPFAVNVIPGFAEFTLEIRDLDIEKIGKLFLEIEKESKEIEKLTKTEISFTHLLDNHAALADERMQTVIAEEAERLSLSSKRLPSFAGHDAQHCAPCAEMMGMIFIPSEKGISHSPLEFSTEEDMENGANVMLQSILAIDSQYK